MLSERVKLFVSSCKHFVRIALMTDIPNNGIARAVKNTVQCYSKLNYTEIACQMTAVFAYNVYDFSSYFCSKFC